MDTCIISGIARNDLTESESAALLKLLRLRKRGQIDIVTSEHAAVEISRVPIAYRRPHELVLCLLADVPTVQTFGVDSGLLLLGVGGGSREDPLFSILKTILPDMDDAHHVFQASKNNATFFLTVDQKTILKHSEALFTATNVTAIAPAKLVALLENGVYAPGITGS